LDLFGFSVYAIVVCCAEFLVYRYTTRIGRFSAPKIEQQQIDSTINRIANMKPEHMINIIRVVRDDLAKECSHEPVQNMLQFSWGLSEEISERIADKYGTRFSQESKLALDTRLTEFACSYSKGMKLETYDAIAAIFQAFLCKDKSKIEKVDRIALSKRLMDSSKDLEKGSSRSFLDLMSQYVQRSFDEADVLLFINGLNDLIYRTRSYLCEGPIYHEFLIEASEDLKQASMAIKKEDSYLLYDAYERVFRKANIGVQRVEAFRRAD